MASRSREGHGAVIFKVLGTRKFTHVPMNVWTTHSELSWFFPFSFGCRVQGKEGWTWEEWEVSMKRVHFTACQIINKDIGEKF